MSHSPQKWCQWCALCHEATPVSLEGGGTGGWRCESIFFPSLCSLSYHPHPLLFPLWLVNLFTACADAYLTPCIHRYVEGFASGFKDKVNTPLSWHAICTSLLCYRLNEMQGIVGGKPVPHTCCTGTSVHECILFTTCCKCVKIEPETSGLNNHLCPMTSSIMMTLCGLYFLLLGV